MDIHLCVIQSRSELGSKRYIFMENDKIISLRNLFQLSTEFYLNEKLNLYCHIWREISKSMQGTN